ncbi:MAG: stage II sporulation protein M [Candidatus Brocadiae bacterium]|nr:stage II sporulation protein M [Candidatus Brocadiia bacterium]
MLKSVEFRKKRDKSWTKLEEYLQKGEKKGLRSFSPQELEELVSLYRMASSSFYVARSISLDKSLNAYLQALVSRAYFLIYGHTPKGTNPVSHFFMEQFPQIVRKYFLYHFVAMILFVMGMVAGFWATMHNPGNYFAFIDAELAQGRTPFASKEELQKALQSNQNMELDKKTLFSAFLFTHNTKVGFLSFSCGIALGLPTTFLMVQNGSMLGALGAAYHKHHLDIGFWAWILPHGITEILAIIFCAGSGFVLAMGIIKPGKYGRVYALKSVGQEAGLMVAGTIPMFFFAGIVESFFRQTSLPDGIRYLFALVTLVFWILYLGFYKRPERNA